MPQLRFYRASGRYGFLSNLFPCKVQIGGRTFPSAEHAYQFGKPRDPLVAEWLMAAPSPALCALVAHALLKWHVRSDWRTIKVERMRAVLQAKFEQNPALLDSLRDTGDAELVEESATDAFWGVGKYRRGQNMLGKLLMEIRAESRSAALGAGRVMV